MDSESLAKKPSPETLRLAMNALHQSFCNIRLLLIEMTNHDSASYRNALDHTESAEWHVVKCFEETYGELPPLRINR